MNSLKIKDLFFHSIGPVNLRVDSAECVCITGPSGAGKSLFLRSLADMEPYRGKISLDGVNAMQMAAPKWRKKVGMLPAESAWWFDTVGEHFSRSPESTETEWFKTLGFDNDVLKWQISRLSGGERQRLALLRLLANCPKSLLLDEPTANLDAENTGRVEKLLETYRLENGTPVIWVSHDPEQLKRVSNRGFLLKEGTFTEIVT